MIIPYAKRKAFARLGVAVFSLVIALAFIPFGDDVYAGDAPATKYVAKKWENGQVVSETKTQDDMVWMTNGHLEWHNNWWYTRDLDELVISDRVSVDNGATANLILMDGKTIKFENGIHVGKGSKLNIYGQTQGTGKLIVGKSKADTAAIGGNAGESNGTINIYGGTIQVTGGSHSSNGGAGIGAGGSASNESSINIYGGTVTANGGANAAGIGGGARGGHGGEISIYGGYVTANGDSGAAGIGGGEGGSGTGTFIHGGEVHANGGSVSSDGGAGIGSGSKAGREGVVAGNVYVYGGKVYAIGGADAAGIGGGNEVNGGNVEVNGVNVGGAYVEASSKTLGAGIGGGQSGGGGTFTIHKGTVKATGGSEGAGIGGGEEGGGVNFTIDGGKVEATGGSYAAGIGTGDVDNGGKDGGTIRISGGEVTAQAGTDAAGIGGGEGASGADVEIRGGTVNASGLAEWGDGGAGIGSGDRDGNDVNAGTIKIYDGIVTATGGADGAGIGGGDHVSGGTIEISGGRVKASTPEDRERSAAAGIGGGDGADGGTIRISGGNVEASGGAAGAGIGGGDNSDGGDIVISGGTVTATGHGGGAGIGGGDDGNGETIKITDGNVTATGSNLGAGIGGGGQGDCGTIEISRGTINATGGEYAPVVNKPSEKLGGPGIGNGGKNSGDTTQKITISGGNITARGMSGGAGIGSGYRGNSDNTSITISDCEKLIASSGTEGAGIGGGDGANGGNITITGGKSITANGGGAAAGIGGGFGGDGGQITISGGNIKTSGGTNKDYAGAGIGGGCNGRSGKITIDGGTIEANGGNNGGAGIGSGGLCEKDENTVDVTINGGTIVAKGGDGLVYEDAAGHWTWYPGAAIGAGGYEYKNNHSDEKSYFDGNIYLNDGDITLKPCGVNRYSQGDKWFEFDENHSNYYNLIGTTNDKGLEDVTGNVFFNGAIVTMNNGKGRDGSYAQPVRASNVYISDEHVRQRVSYKVNENDGLTTVNKDARISTLSLTGNNQVVVGHCQHENSTYVDNGSNHSLTCNSCGVTATLSHEYGNPAWTWGEDHASAVAKFTCSVCKHIETLNAAVTPEEFEAIGEDPAKTVYTAKVTLGEQEYTDIVEMPHGLPNASITAEPTAKTLTYNGHEQELVTAGTVSGGQMLYALGDESGATEEFTETLPVGTDAGDYKVWYMVKGDDGHNDIPAKSMNAAIGQADFSAVTFSLNPDEAFYTGSAIKPEVSGTFNAGTAEEPDRIAVDASEYSFSYDDNVNAGTATVSITSSEKNFTGGTTNLEFEIKKAPNNVAVSMVGWAKGEEASTPNVTADFGADTASFEYKGKDAADSTYTSTVPSDVGEYTVKVTIAGTGNYEAGEATCDFAIIQKKYTVTFDPNDGTGTKEAESIAENDSYTLPDAETFGVPADKCSFSAWEVKIGSAEPVEKAPGDSITITADTTVKALWEEHDWSPVEYKWSDDNSQVTAARTCGNDSSHIETETAETTSEVTKEATEEEAGTRTYTATFRNPAFETQTKDVSIPKLEFVNLTFIGSSIVGDDVVESYTVRIPKGSAIQDLRGDDEYDNIIAHFTTSEYVPYDDEIYVTVEPLSTYTNWNDLEDDNQYWEEIDSDTTFYLALSKLVDSIDLSVEKPLCGTDMEDGPVVSVKDGSSVTLEEGRTKWWDREKDETILSGTIEGEKTYGARVYINPAFGYCIYDSNAPTVTVENSDSDSVQIDANGSMAKITFAVTADYDWNETSYEWSEDNKSVTATRTCKRDDKHVETETVDATSKVTKPATIDARGETTYTSAEFTNTAFDIQKKTVEDIDKVNPTPLSDAIKAAKDAENGVKTSADGKDVEPTDMYTTAAEKKALDDAIDAAQKVEDDLNSTQKDVDDAVDAITKAKEKYDAAKKPGKKESGKKDDKTGKKGEDGTALGKGASAATADKAITGMKSDADPAGSSFAPLKLKSTKQAKNSIKLNWTKTKGAVKYVVYGNACGKKNKMKKLATVSKNTYNVKKISRKLKKATYHKFIVVALDKNNNVVSSSKVIHVATNGSKNKANPKGLTVKAKVNKNGKKLKKWTKTNAVGVKTGKTVAIKAAITKAKKTKVKKHVAPRFESSNTKIATVSKSGKIKAKAKGKCIIYVFAQNGISKTIKVTVK